MKKFRTYSLAVDFYHASRGMKLPKHLRDQFDRACTSIVLNLAEGSGRGSKMDQKRFYSIAMGSFRECEAVLALAIEKNGRILELKDRLGGSLFRLMKW